MPPLRSPRRHEVRISQAHYTFHQVNWEPQKIVSGLPCSPPKHSADRRNTTVVPICASWFLPNDPEGRTGHGVFKQQRIPSARFFDLDAVKDNDSKYPHMLPTAEDFAKAMQEIGIRKDDEVVIYDSKELGIFSAPRVGWTFKVFGHPSVHLLNNFRLWVEQGYPTESGEVEAVVEKPSHYPTPQVDPEKVVKFAEVKNITKDYGKEGAEEIQILDARPKGRWAGTTPEPRPGLSSGHIPGSINVPHSELLDPKTGTLLPSDELRRIFESKGVDPEKPIISSCGTGVTAGTYFGVHLATFEPCIDSRDMSRKYVLPGRVPGLAIPPQTSMTDSEVIIQR